MKGITQSFIGTTEEWEAANTRLYENVWGMEIRPDGKRLFKVGKKDPQNPAMTLPWNDLEYFDEENIAGLPEHLRHIENDVEQAVEDSEYAKNLANETRDNLDAHTANRSNPHEVTAEQLGALKLESPTTQVIDSDVAMAEGQKILGTNPDGSQEELIGLGVYDAGIQTEVGSEKRPMCLNHNVMFKNEETGQSSNVGKNISVNYKDENGLNHDDKAAYLSDVQEAADAAAAALATVNTAKVDKAAAGDAGTMLLNVAQKDDVTTSLILIKKLVNVLSGSNSPILVEMALRLADETNAGVMPAESFAEIKELILRVAALENKSVHYPVNLESATPTQEQLQTAYEAVSGNTGAAYDMTSLDDLSYGKSYTWYESQNEWVDKGTTIINQATNDSFGVSKGSTNSGQMFAEQDGTWSLNGYDAIITAIDNAVAEIESQAENITALETNKANLESPAFTGSPTREESPMLAKTDVVNNLVTTIVDVPLSAAQGKALNDIKAPNSHASSATTYGIGTTTSYGHVKTINALTQSSHADGAALSAYQGYVLNQNKAPLASPAFSGNVILPESTTYVSSTSRAKVAAVGLTATSTDTNLPVGSYISANAGDQTRNTAYTVYLNGSSAYRYSGPTDGERGTALSGTWRSCGCTHWNAIYLYRRVA
jgi:hypothetical protein